MLYLLKAESLCEDRWRLPGDTIIAGSLGDLTRSVDCVKQLEDYAYLRQSRNFGEDGLLVSAEYTGAGWYASIRPYLGCSSKIETEPHRSEAIARIEALIAYFAAQQS